MNLIKSTLKGYCLLSCLNIGLGYASQEKNILFIGIDDLKPLLGCYGDSIAITPNIDMLASKGTLFERAYCQQAVSGPTRASLLTGMCPDKTRVWDLKTLIRNENPDVLTLPQYLKNEGYITYGIGKIFDQRSVDKNKDSLSWSLKSTDGWEFINKDFPKPILGSYQSKEISKKYNNVESILKQSKKNKEEEKLLVRDKGIKPTTEAIDVPDNVYQDGAIAEGAIKFLNEYNSEKPFFLAVGFRKPHLPFVAPKKYWDLYDRGNMPLAKFKRKAANSPDFAYHNSNELQLYSDIPPLYSFSDISNTTIPDEKARELIHGYYACISYIDNLIGNIIKTLKSKGFEDNTVIILWGDHGWHLGDHGLWNKHTNFEQATHVPLIIIDPSIKKQKERISEPVEFLSIYPTLCDIINLKKPKHLDGKSIYTLLTNENNNTNNNQYAVSQYPRGNKMGYSIRTSNYRYTIWVKWENKHTDINTVYAEELYDYNLDYNETINVVNDKHYKDILNEMRLYWNDYCKKRIQ